MELYWPLVWGGAAIVVALLLNLFITLFLTWRLIREPKKPQTNITPDMEELRKAKEMRKGFMNMMNYDVDKALQRKKVQ